MQSIYSIPGLSNFLQTQMHKILGPLLILIGMFLLEMISINLPSLSSSSKMQNIFKNMGMWGAFPLGIIFALSFCPVSAALYFGSLIPLATQFSSSLILPSMYGIGTGLPVFIFAILIALGTGWVSKAFNNIGKFEHWFRMITGIIFVIVGIYLCLVYIFGVL
ncbi:MAG: cytochrome c biogenesis protein CcdA [bacterium]